MSVSIADGGKRSQRRQFNYDVQLMDLENQYAVENAATAQGYNKELMQLQYGYDTEAATTAFEREKELASLEAYYNSPVYQHDALISAGYNPNALMSGYSANSVSVGSAPMASSQAVTGAPNAGAPSSPGVSAPNDPSLLGGIMDTLSQVNDLFKTQSQLQNDQSQRELNRISAIQKSVESDYTAANTIKTQADAEFQTLVNNTYKEYGDEKASAEVENLQKSNKLLQDEIDKSAVDVRITQEFGYLGAMAAYERQILENDNISQQVKQMIIKNDYLPRELAANLNLNYAQLAVNNSQVSLNSALTEQATSHASYFDAMASSSNQNSAMQLQEFNRKKALEEMLLTEDGLKEVCNWYNCREEEARAIVHDVVWNGGKISDRYSGYTNVSKYNYGDWKDKDLDFQKVYPGSLIRNLNFIMSGTLGSLIRGAFQ